MLTKLEIVEEHHLGRHIKDQVAPQVPAQVDEDIRIEIIVQVLWQVRNFVCAGIRKDNYYRPPI